VPIELDHLILSVSEPARSAEFYRTILGLEAEPNDGPFTPLRVTSALTILLSPGGSDGGEHLAFALTKAEFDSVMARIVEAGIPYGDRFDGVGNMQGPGDEFGARGMGAAVYFFDPDRHVIEIRHYESIKSASRGGAAEAGEIP
jgi:catechol 2,3-dioxygenase-like lactoylglutathione lyase family enzyme